MTLNFLRKPETNNLFYLFLWIYLCFTAMNSITLIGRFEFDVLVLARICLIFFVAWNRTSFGLFILAAISLYDTWQFLPTTSNSIMFGFMLNLCFVIAYISGAIKNRTPIITADNYFDSFAAAGRLLLLTMYFFGVFQKINTGFLDPNLSYAVVLLDYFSFFPQALVETDFLRYSAIYATFIIETAIFIALILPKYRYYGIVVGLCFHMFLSLNEYHSYVTFTCLSFAMHFLFLDPKSVNRFKKGRVGKIFFDEKYRVVKYSIYAFFISLFFISVSAMTLYNDSLVRMKLWIPAGFTICWFALYYDTKVRRQKETILGYFNSKNIILTTLCVFFFFSQFSPYIGLKNGQSVTMFSNLKIEEGKSNHLVFREPIELFDHLRYPIKIITTTHPKLKKYMGTDFKVAAFVVEYHMANSPEEAIVYIQNGKLYYYRNGIPPKLAEQWKKPTFLYKLLSFQGFPPEYHRGL